MKVCDFCGQPAVRTIKISYLLPDMRAEIKWEDALLGFDVCKQHELEFIKAVNKFKQNTKIKR